MNGKASFWVAALLIAALTLILTVRCGPGSFSFPEATALSANASPLPENALCIKFGKLDEVILYPQRADQACPQRYKKWSFAISDARPTLFTLYGMPNVNFCVEIMREKGYITLSRNSGKITRNGEQFRWCVEIDTHGPSSMVVRSLTDRAEFTLTVP